MCLPARPVPCLPRAGGPQPRITSSRRCPRPQPNRSRSPEWVGADLVSARPPGSSLRLAGDPVRIPVPACRLLFKAAVESLKVSRMGRGAPCGRPHAWLIASGSQVAESGGPSLAMVAARSLEALEGVGADLVSARPPGSSPPARRLPNPPACRCPRSRPNRSRSPERVGADLVSARPAHRLRLAGGPVRTPRPAKAAATPHAPPTRHPAPHLSPGLRSHARRASAPPSPPRRSRPPPRSPRPAQ